MFPTLRNRVLAYDTETTGLKWWVDRIFGVAIAMYDENGHGSAYYWDVRDNPRVLEWLRDELPLASQIFAHHAKFDWHMSRESGVIFPDDGRVQCTMTRAALIDEHRLTYDLDAVGKACIGVGKDGDIYQDLAEIFGGHPTKNAQMKNLPRAPVELVARYAKQDAITCLKLGLWQDGEIERQGLEKVLALETEVMPVLVDMEWKGVRVDVDAAEKAIDDITKIVNEEQKALDSAAGFAVNPNPSGSIHKLFNPQKNENGQWVLNDGTIAQSTDAGKASIDADCLRRMKHPLAAKILNVRKLMKARDTFLKGHVLGHHHNGVVHTCFNQTKNDNEAGTGTGRLSSTQPALQQISARDKNIAAIVRAVFIPDYGTDWTSIDWAQVDFRVAAHYIKDPAIMAKYAENPDADFHQMTADITGLPRSPRFAGDPNAKQINLGLAFGMGSGKLAAEMGLPYTAEKGFKGKEFLKPGPEAEAVFEKYHGSMPGIKVFMDSASSVARNRGYVISLAGRHIRFPGGQFVHKAAGLLYQSGAADMQKIKIVECHKASKEVGARLMLSVHDELNFSTPRGDKAAVDRINEVYCDFGSNARLQLRVPIRSSVGVGPNWWEACK